MRLIIIINFAGEEAEEKQKMKKDLNLYNVSSNGKLLKFNNKQMKKIVHHYKKIRFLVLAFPFPINKFFFSISVSLLLKIGFREIFFFKF